MSNETTFIPAPAGHQLATWHWANCAEQYLLLGWAMDARPYGGHSGVGNPIVQYGMQARVLHPDWFLHHKVLTADEARDFDLSNWDDQMSGPYEERLKIASGNLVAALAADGRAVLRTRIPDLHYDHGAADRLVTDGMAQWEDGQSAILPVSSC